MQDVEWLKSITNLPTVVKGILIREDGQNRQLRGHINDIVQEALGPTK